LLASIMNEFENLKIKSTVVQLHPKLPNASEPLRDSPVPRPPSPAPIPWRSGGMEAGPRGAPGRSEAVALLVPLPFEAPLDPVRQRGVKPGDRGWHPGSGKIRAHNP